MFLNKKNILGVVKYCAAIEYIQGAPINQVHISVVNYSVCGKVI